MQMLPQRWLSQFGEEDGEIAALIGAHLFVSTEGNDAPRGLPLQ